MSKGKSRRDFLRRTLTGVAVLPWSPKASASSGDSPRRPLGQTGEKVSIITLGGDL